MSNVVMFDQEGRREQMRRARIDGYAAEARREVESAIAMKVTHTVLTQAVARAERLVRAGESIQNAVKRAVAWALYCDHPGSKESA